ncbi:MAG TPA: hypothetical protein V6D15_09575 [Oculatellaceae cyanobacterium]|jgi:uncharacterized protein (UPF0332 family)
MYPHPFKDLSSNIFWNNSHEKQAQKFYIALCLYGSAAYDFTVSIDLRTQQKLNWSITTSYYSIVHSARLIIFDAVGDYPKNHNNLSKFFVKKEEIIVDWLNHFALSQDGTKVEENKITLPKVVEYYEKILGLEDANKSLESIGKILKNAQDLRNDSNYEALLMAHEVNHISVSKNFQELATTMSDCAKHCLLIATNCFHHYLNQDPDLNKERMIYKYFVHKYMREQFNKIIENKIINWEAIEQVHECTNSLEQLTDDCPSEDINKKLSHLEDMVSVDLFGSKAALMDKFEQKINTLKDNFKSAVQESATIG